MPEPIGTPCCYGKLIEACRGFARDDVVMGRLAPDDAAERDAGAMAPGPADEAVGERETEREGNLQRARHGDTLEVNLIATQLVFRATRELVGDILVEARLDDEDGVSFAAHDDGSRPR